MKTIEVRSLLTDNKKVIDIPTDIEKVFNVWKSKIKKNDDFVLDPVEIFYAGYVLSNPIVRKQYLDADKVINKK